MSISNNPFDQRSNNKDIAEEQHESDGAYWDSWDSKWDSTWDSNCHETFAHSWSCTAGEFMVMAGHSGRSGGAWNEAFWDLHRRLGECSAQDLLMMQAYSMGGV